MKGFMKAELYKICRNRIAVILSLLMGIMILGVAYMARDAVSLEFVCHNLDFVTLGAFVAVILVLSILSEEISAGTLKNQQALDYRIDKVLQWKAVVQLVKAMVLFAYFLLVLIGAGVIMQYGTGIDMELLKHAVIKIVISIPAYVAAVFIMDIVFLKIKSAMVTVILYYYVVIQLILIFLIAGHGNENQLAGIFLMPVQLGYLYSHELTANTILCTLISELLYVVMGWGIYVLTTKQYAYGLVRGNR